MTKRDAAKARLQNIETELRSISTCTTATVAELQTLLYGEAAQSQKENIRAKSARATSAQPTARRRPGTATASKTEDAAGCTPLLTSRERYVLATQTVNTTLKSLTDALKTPASQRAAQPPPKSKPPANVATNTQKPQRSVSQYPLKERSVSHTTNSPATPKSLRRSSSYSTLTGPDPGLIATAECARVAIGYLNTSESIQFLGKDSPELALENGRLSLVGKLVAHGLDNQAVKEMQLLKKRLDIYIGTRVGKEHTRPASTRPASEQAAPMGRDGLATLLDFGDVDYNSAAIPIIINLQIYVLRVLGRIKRPRSVEVAWDFLKLSHPSSPANLISHTATVKANTSKAARQLESLAQAILRLCPSISSSADEEPLQPSPDIVLCLQHLAFGIRQRWWELAQHQGDEGKELIEPFGRCLAAFARRSTLPTLKKYRTAESLYSNLLDAGNDLDFSHRDGKKLSGPKNSTLASLARAADLPSEALRWLGTPPSSAAAESSAAVTVRLVRIAANSLETHVNDQSKISQDVTVDAALQGLSRSLDGTAKDMESLLVEVHALRRIACRIVSSSSSAEFRTLSPILEQQCVRIVSASVRFSRRFVGNRPPDDAPQKTLASYQARLTMAAKLARSTIESVSVCCKLHLESDATWNELDALIQECVCFASQLEEESVYHGYAGPASQEAAQSLFVRFSNSYWALRRQLPNLDPGSVPVQTAMQRSIALLQSRSQEEKKAGQLSFKLERLGEEFDKLDLVQESREAYAQCIQTLLDDGLCTTIVEATANQHVVHAFEKSHLLIDLGRVLRLHHRSFVRCGLNEPDELAFFDDCRYTAVARGALLEWQLDLYQQTLSKNRPWNPALNLSIRTMANRLLSLYVPAQFPVRRRRLHLFLLQLSHMYPDILSDTYVSGNYQTENFVNASDTEDRNLSRFEEHLRAMLTLKTLLQEGDLTTHKLRNCLSTWQSMLDSARSWDEMVKQIDNTDHWLEAIQASVDLLCAKGEEYQALPILHLLIRILELQGSADPSQLIIAVCTLGLQFLRLGYSGKAGLAFAKVEGLLSTETASTEAKLRWYLGYAEYLLNLGNARKCESILSAAETLARNDTRFTDLSKPSTNLSVRMTYNKVVAEACYVSSLLCSNKGDHKNAARYARQAVLLNRRIWATQESSANARKAASATSEGPSAVHFDPLSSMREEKGAPLTSSITHDALKGPDFWSLIPSLYRALTQHSIVIASQGSLEEAVYVLQQAEKVASAIGSRTLLVDYTSRLAELWIQSGRSDKAEPLLDGLDMSNSAEHLSTISYHLSLARMHHASHKFENENAEYDRAEKLLRHLSSPSYVASMAEFTSDLEALTNNVSTLTLDEPKPAKQTRSMKTRATGSRAATRTVAKTNSRTTRKAPLKSAPTPVSRVQKKVATSPTVEKHSSDNHCTSLEAFQVDITYRRVATYVLQEDIGKAMDMLSQIEMSKQKQDGSHAWVHFKAMLAQAIRSISDDFTFNTLPESTIAFPSIPPKDRRSSEGIKTKRSATKSTIKMARNAKQARDDFVELIQSARESLIEAHTQHATAASNHVFRQLSAALSHATILLSAISQGRIGGSIHPLYSAYMSEIPKHHALSLAQNSVEVEQETMSREVYLQWPKPTLTQPTLASPVDFQHDYIDIIPETWTAVSLALSEEQDEIYITRYQRATSPFVLRLPLARHSSRDLDDEEFTFADGKQEFEEIIELSDFTTRNAKDLTSREGRRQWWDDRQALDTKLRELLLNIENIWLGGFKGIFSNHNHQPALLACFRKSFDNILNRHLPSRQKKGLQKKQGLDPRVLELFIGLGDALNPELDLDEALTDLIYFVVDILQFNGEPNAYDEIDFDSMVVETHEALCTYHNNAQRTSPEAVHTILILDKNLHMLPWESLPCLEKLSISRLPSLAALRERLMTARLPALSQNAPPGHYISAEAGGTSILNPSGDLGHTSNTIKPHLDGMQGTWTHIANRAPSEKEFEGCLRNDQLVLFFGHGSGAQYIRSKAVRRLFLNTKSQSENDNKKPGCATTFLFGCSSVHLSENGIYEPSGMLSSYLTAGAPAVLGMLWDVTDKDCDRLAVKAGELWGLWPERQPEEKAKVEPPLTIKKKKGKGRVAQLAEEVETPRSTSKSRKGKDLDANEDANEAAGRRRGMGLDEAIRDARKACVLRYLNGAAAVVYGIPVYLE